MKHHDNECFIFIVEHQSTNDSTIAIRLKEYEIAIVRQYYKNKTKCPVIFPIVVYNGDVKYNAPKNYWDLFRIYIHPF